MHFATLYLGALATLTLAPTVLSQAIGSARVTNNCAEPVYLWHVGGSVGAKQTIGQGQTYNETIVRDPSTGGVALKVTRVDDGLFQPGVPQTVFSYTLDQSTGTVWYDLSDVFGDAFAGSNVEVLPSVTTCPAILWPAGVSPGGSQVKVCGAGYDYTLILC